MSLRQHYNVGSSLWELCLSHSWQSCLLYRRLYTTIWAESDSSLPYGAVRLVEPEDHRTYIMYHGTSRLAAQQILACVFHPSCGDISMLGCGIYLSQDLEKASRYLLNLPDLQSVVSRLMLTAWLPRPALNCDMVPSGLEDSCVWDPNRIDIIDTIQHNICSMYAISMLKYQCFWLLKSYFTAV
uniref:PARP catalytic domain-containing protein n=1 Tax=Hucho hucho TaxID=62062 RepID=A0A4W5K7Z3_9TELE